MSKKLNVTANADGWMQAYQLAKYPPPITSRSMSFFSGKTDPVLQWFGRGTPVQKTGYFNPFQPNPSYQYQRVPFAGYGGLSAGMMYASPLSANSLGTPLPGGLG